MACTSHKSSSLGRARTAITLAVRTSGACDVPKRNVVRSFATKRDQSLIRNSSRENDGAIILNPNNRLASLNPISGILVDTGDNAVDRRHQDRVEIGDLQSLDIEVDALFFVIEYVYKVRQILTGKELRKLLIHQADLRTQALCFSFIALESVRKGSSRDCLRGIRETPGRL